MAYDHCSRNIYCMQKGRKERRDGGKEERRRHEKMEGILLRLFLYLLNGFSHMYSHYVEVHSIVEKEIIIPMLYITI